MVSEMPAKTSLTVKGAPGWVVSSFGGNLAGRRLGAELDSPQTIGGSAKNVDVRTKISPLVVSPTTRRPEVRLSVIQQNYTTKPNVGRRGPTPTTYKNNTYATIGS